MEAPPPGGIILPLPRAWPRRFVRGHRLRAFVLFCFFLRPAVLLRVLPRLPAKTCPTSGQATGTAVSVDFVLATPPMAIKIEFSGKHVCSNFDFGKPGPQEAPIAIGGRR